MTDKAFAKIKRFLKGQYVDQNGPSSFSKSEDVVTNYAKGGYDIGTQLAVFVLNGGTKCGRDMSSIHGYASEKEVIVGSTSNMRVSKIQVNNGITDIFGKEEKYQYISHTRH